MEKQLRNLIIDFFDEEDLPSGRKKYVLLEVEMDIFISEIMKLFKKFSTLPSDETILKIIEVTADVDFDRKWVWGADTDLGTPEEIVNKVKDILSEDGLRN